VIPGGKYPAHHVKPRAIAVSDQVEAKSTIFPGWSGDPPLPGTD
jgi:hypothetical protein